MLKQIYKNNLTINYKDIGSGPVVLLIHGFLETLEIWSGFDEELAENFRVLSVDLPGHGKSDLHHGPFTMCKYAESVKFILEEEDIDAAFMIGHSMGGYVTMSFYENYPDLLTGLCLFHSSPFADREKKKEARTDIIKQIVTGKYHDIYTNHVKNVYADDNIDLFNKEIEKAKNVAGNLNEDSVIVSLESMRTRKDRSQLFSKCTVPVLYILGMKDKFILPDILEFLEFPEKNKIIKLENSGHMGMIEEKEKSLTEINDFINEYI